MSTDVHDPVMIGRVIELLSPALVAPGAVCVDCTLGLAGHARGLLEAAPSARFVGIDRDPDALAVARERLGPLARRVTLVKAVYDELPDVLAGLGIGQVQAVLADLGLSSLQIDRRDRGFAYRVDAPLDMRMSAGEGPTAADLLNTAPTTALTQILRRRGSRNALPPRSCRRGEASPSPRQLSSSRSSPALFPPLPGRLLDTLRNAPSKRSGSRSTTSWPCWDASCPPPREPWQSVAGSRSWPITPWRTGW